MKSPHGTVTSKAKLLMCTADLRARAQILNIKQYNGKQDVFTVKMKELHNHQAISSRTGGNIQRTDEKMRGDAKKAAEEGNVVCDDFTSVNGLIVCHVLLNFCRSMVLKGASILSAHESFKLSWGCQCLNGNRGKPFSIRNKICTRNVPAHQ